MFTGVGAFEYRMPPLRLLQIVFYRRPTSKGTNLMDAPSLPRVARPAGRRVAAPVVAVATQRPAQATAPPAPAADQDGDDPSLDFTTPATRDESEALAEAEPVTNPEPEPQTVAEPIPATPAPTTPTAVVAPTPAAVATAAATPIATPASPSPGGGLRTLVVIRNGVVDYDDNTVQVLDMDSLHDAGAHDLADALLALKGADRSTIKDTAFAELMTLFNTAIS